ncbi:unnamed protein product [Acanthoscelides obtectus]|uniref:Uncharacterized protein n=1 Tax=Acanthoscelides obtectus TaxID=200917 RepID=A0A9P0Q7C2_ACAOB|nr:unnamed protein product [Acanthoscelides obtectus]CAH2011782.1 unnamed protein product [Acanthoscelides obtectus]CAK1652797.1 hypothetical protein AOBTE_LOCUS17910 [Acanthoscelides obtectus]CAK1652840.1 hypothetical protein AOBTE_LOCUS17932 [Acanthoscelides obtectus]
MRSTISDNFEKCIADVRNEIDDIINEALNPKATKGDDVIIAVTITELPH